MSAAVLGLLHPGQMGAAIAAQAQRTGTTVLWCPTGRSEASRQRAHAAGLNACKNLTDLCERADIILSVCPPAAAETVATDVATHGFSGVYVEANAIDPARFTRISQTLTGSRTVLDAAIIGPPPTDDRPATLYLAGEEAAANLITDMFAATTVRTIHLTQPPPAASALKMAYASYQKASRALAAVAHALARRYDVTEHLLTEAERSRRSPLAEPDYLSSVAARAWRWAPELRDVAATLTDNDLPPDLAQAAATVLDRWENDKDDDSLTTAETLNRLQQGQPPETGAPRPR